MGVGEVAAGGARAVGVMGGMEAVRGGATAGIEQGSSFPNCAAVSLAHVAGRVRGQSMSA